MLAVKHRLETAAQQEQQHEVLKPCLHSQARPLGAYEPSNTCTAALQMP